LQRIGIACPDCETESIFDLSKDQTANVGRICPRCGNSKFLESFVTEQKQKYNWVTYYKRGKEITKNVTVRLYFDQASKC
jgi:hypothetical protein